MNMELSLVLPILCLVYSASAYVVLNGSLPEYDSPVETTSYKHNFYNHHYNMLSKEEIDLVDTTTKRHVQKDSPKIIHYEPKIVSKNSGKVNLKAIDKSNEVNGILNKESGDARDKYPNGIPYYVTKNGDILGAGDLGNAPNNAQFGAMGSVPNMASLPNMGSMGAPKLNFTLGNYMKFLTKNSSLTTADVYKYVFSKKCLKEYNILCLKLDLIKILSNINNDNNRSISIIPHLMSISINNVTSPDMTSSTASSIPIDQDTAADQSSDYASLLTQQLEDATNREFVKNKEVYEAMVLKNNYNTNYYINNILKKKIIGLLNNMTLNIKLFDTATIGIVRRLVHGYGGLGEDVSQQGAGEKEVFDGRAPITYTQYTGSGISLEEMFNKKSAQ